MATPKKKTPSKAKKPTPRAAGVVAAFDAEEIANGAALLVEAMSFRSQEQGTSEQVAARVSFAREAGLGAKVMGPPLPDTIQAPSIVLQHSVQAAFEVPPEQQLNARYDYLTPDEFARELQEQEATADEDAGQPPSDLPPIAKGRRSRASREELAPKLNRPVQLSSQASRAVEPPGAGANLQSIGEDPSPSYDEEEVAVDPALLAGAAAVRHADTPAMRKLDPSASKPDDPPNIARGRRERASRDDMNPRMARPPPKS